mmetsp:Transcript_94794/g.294823  ORF Transcript_94794/g.294823 Transcript_94794/m.294823 type:complete len:188 (-) Transcript_94794:30-593(-)
MAEDGSEEDGDPRVLSGMQPGLAVWGAALSVHDLVLNITIFVFWVRSAGKLFFVFLCLFNGCVAALVALMTLAEPDVLDWQGPACVPRVRAYQAAVAARCPAAASPRLLAGASAYLGLAAVPRLSVDTGPADALWKVFCASTALWLAVAVFLPRLAAGLSALLGWKPVIGRGGSGGDAGGREAAKDR